MRDKVLETERMLLRRMDMSDVDFLMDIFSDPVAMRYYPGTKSRQEAEDWVRWTETSPKIARRIAGRALAEKPRYAGC